MNKGITTSACVSPSNDGTLVLKRNHPYYYQVQLQLLVTEVQYCDFVLHSKVGQPCIIRVFKDVNLQRQILENTTKFWVQCVCSGILSNASSS